MIHYVVVTGQPARVARAQPGLAEAMARTRYFEGPCTVHQAPSQAWSVAAISVPDPVMENRLLIDDDALLVLNGPALAADGDQEKLGPRLFRELREGGTAAAASSLAGGYNLTSVTPELGLRAFGDFSGLYPLYYFQGGGLVVVSNRPSTIAEVVGHRKWDLRALSWVVGHSNLFGDEMPAKGVRYLPPGQELRAGWRKARAEVQRSPTWIWPAPSDEPLRSNLTSDEWDEITEELIDGFRALSSLDQWPRLLLSGGKDSRLCLALVKAAGLEDRVRAVTNGKADSPELACAIAVAEAGGFEHTHVKSVGRQTPTPPPFNAENVWRRLRQAVYRYDGIVNPWDGLTDPVRGTIVNIKGFGGEFYRRSHAPRFKKSGDLSLDEMAAQFVDFHQKMDPLGALRPGEADYQRDYLRDWVHETAKHVRLDLLPEKFYVDYRLGHWNGALGQFKAGYININPLLAHRAGAKSLELAMDARQNERFHYEVMRRAAPELVTIPFLADTWSPQIRDDSPLDLPTEGFPTVQAATTKVMKTWQWRFIETQTAELEQLIRDATRDARLGKFCNPQRLIGMTRRGPQLTNNVRVKALVATAAVCLAVLDRGEPNYDRPILENS